MTLRRTVLYNAMDLLCAREAKRPTLIYECTDTTEDVRTMYRIYRGREREKIGAMPCMIVERLYDRFPYRTKTGVGWWWDLLHVLPFFRVVGESEVKSREEKRTMYAWGPLGRMYDYSFGD